MDQASWRRFVISLPTEYHACAEPDIPGNLEKCYVTDEDIITYFCRLLRPEHSDHLLSQLSEPDAPPLERLSRCGISVRRPAVGETIAEAGNAHPYHFCYEVLKEP